MDDFWTPEAVPKSSKPTKYRFTCRCGHQMRVRTRHFGRMCRCTQCQYPIYVTTDIVEPPFDSSAEEAPRVFSEDNAPALWQRGDLVTELYDVRETIGKGGMGIVHRVHHRGWDVDVAVKCPLEKYMSVKNWAEHFEHECETWINLSRHPNTLTCYYFRRLGGIPRVFVEYVKGMDLWRGIAERRLYEGGHEASLLRMLDITIQFAWGLEHAHNEGLVHQDVKPANVLVSQDGQVKITDFGMARVYVDGDSLASGNGGGSFRGPKGGTPPYRSPDHKLQNEVTHKSDIWSWGLSVLEMFAGKVFWASGADARSALDRVVKDGYRRREVPVMPAGLAGLLGRCFEQDPENRPHTMGDVADELMNLYEEAGAQPYGREKPTASAATVDIMNNRAVSFLDLGRSRESEELWTNSLEMQSDYLEANYNLNLHLWRTCRQTDVEFIEKLQEICDSRPGETLPVCLLARAHMERGDCQAAINLLEPLTKTEGYSREIALVLAHAQKGTERDTRLIWKIQAHSHPVTAVCISFDGWRTLTGSADGLIRMWEMSFGMPTALFQGHTGSITSVCLSQNEERVLSSSDDGTLRVWDPSTGDCLKVLQGHKDSVLDAALSWDGHSALSAGNDHALKLWDLDTGSCVRTFEGHSAAVTTTAFLRDGRRALSGSRDHFIKVWDIETGQCIRSLARNSKRVQSVAVCGSPSLAMSGSGRKVKIWDLDSEQPLRSFWGHNHEVIAVSLSDDGRYGISATARGTIKIWDTKTGQCLRSLRGHAPAALSSDGRFVITGKKDGTFRVWAVNYDIHPRAAPYLLCRGETSQ